MNANQYIKTLLDNSGFSEDNQVINTLNEISKSRVVKHIGDLFDMASRATVSKSI